MHSVLKIVALMFTAALLFGCKTTAEHTRDMGWKLGNSYEGHFNLTRFDFPLPEGEWVLVKDAFDKNNAGQIFEHFTLARIQNNTITEFIELSATQNVSSPRYSGWESYYVCDGYYMLRRNVIRNIKTSKDCWMIGSRKFLPVDVVPETDQHYIVGLANAVDLKLPMEFMSLTHEFASRKHFLTIHHFTSVDLYRNATGYDVPENLKWVGRQTRELTPAANRFIDSIAVHMQSKHQEFAHLFDHPDRN